MEFSVVVPCYNEEVLLPHTLRLLREAISRFNTGGSYAELIVVDDLSTDRSREIALTVADRVVSGTRLGIGACRNVGARSASGKCVVFVDADTEVPQDLLLAIQEARERGVRAGAVPPTYQAQNTLMRIYFSIWARYARRRGMVQGVCQFIDRDLFDSLGGYDESLKHAEDNDLHQRAVELVGCQGQPNSVTVITAITVTPSMRRYEQSSILWTFLILNPITTRIRLRSTRFWKRWYESPPR